MVIIWLMVVNNLVGGWPTPLKNMSSSMGRMTSHIVWTIKNLPNHQPVITVQNKWYPLPLRWWREIGIDADRTLPNHFVFQMADVQNVLVLKWNRENWIQPPAEYLGKAWMFGFWKGFYPKKKTCEPEMSWLENRLHGFVEKFGTSKFARKHLTKFIHWLSLILESFSFTKECPKKTNWKKWSPLKLPVFEICFQWISGMGSPHFQNGLPKNCFWDF